MQSGNGKNKIINASTRMRNIVKFFYDRDKGKLSGELMRTCDACADHMATVFSPAVTNSTLAALADGMMRQLWR
jgi:hypothetical protein